MIDNYIIFILLVLLNIQTIIIILFFIQKIKFISLDNKIYIVTFYFVKRN